MGSSLSFVERKMASRGALRSFYEYWKRAFVFNPEIENDLFIGVKYRATSPCQLERPTPPECPNDAIHGNYYYTRDDRRNLYDAGYFELSVDEAVRATLEASATEAIGASKSTGTLEASSEAKTSTAI